MLELARVSYNIMILFNINEITNHGISTCAVQFLRLIYDHIYNHGIIVCAIQMIQSIFLAKPYCLFDIHKLVVINTKIMHTSKLRYLWYNAVIQFIMLFHHM